MTSERMTCTMLAVMLQVTLSETTPLKGTALARSVRLSTLLLSAECACRPVCWSAAIPALCSECIPFFELLSVHAVFSKVHGVLCTVLCTVVTALHTIAAVLRCRICSTVTAPIYGALRSSSPSRTRFQPTSLLESTWIKSTRSSWTPKTKTRARPCCLKSSRF
jgi:hypothetical protein